MGLEGTSFGPYRVLRRLGGGGAGEVYLAEESSSGAAAGAPERVALKVIDGQPDDAAVRELVREAEAAANLNNPHVIPYYGLVQTSSSVAVVMGYAPSGSLGDALRAGDRVPLPLAPGVVARIITQVSTALDQAHRAGLVHGDLKPNNLFVRTSPQGTPLAVVSDFGQGVLMRAAATLAHDETSTSEQAAWAGHQLRWASPEQLDGPAQPASDQYALASVAYYLLTGMPPLIGDARAMPALLADGPVAPPSQVNPALPRSGDRVLLRALAKQPSARFPSIGAFAETLSDALAVSAARASGGVGVTAQMSAMSGFSGSEVDDRAESNDPLARNGRSRSAGIARSHRMSANVADVALPDDAPSGLRRVLALCAGMGVFALIVTCALSLFWSGGTLLQLPSTLGKSSSSTTSPTSGGTTGNSPQARAAQQQLAAITSHPSVFSESFRSNAAQWKTGSTSSIHDGHLYLSNAQGQEPGLVTTQTLPRLTSVAVRTDVSLTQGEASDFAGLCFFATTDSKGNESYMCALISPDGRYALWSYARQWFYITGGYTSALKLGLNQVNTLAVLADAPTGAVTLFANGSYLTQVKTGANSSQGATEGLIVLNAGAQAAFTNFAVYNANA
ncbi:MAG TPA: protein kinase [Ktedonobacterales bacterium]